MAKKNTDTRARFAHRLRAIRIPRGFKTARSFAEALDIDENRYTRYERAEVEPDLQLLMKMCGLLGATPNDLLCDTIGTPPIEFEMPYGFAERVLSGYQGPATGRGASSGPAPQAAAQAATQEADRYQSDAGRSLSNSRQAAAWELATLIMELEAAARGTPAAELSELEKLRLIGPIHARIDADVYAFLRELPDRLHGIDVPSESEARIGRLMQEMIAAGKMAGNDNG